ncbi:MAG TPA: AAA family ATPase [Gemmatimonadales bacterium]|nr:AAA family ATPase [Gemmatimonadales bacterium]
MSSLASLFEERVVSWRKLMAAMPDDAGRWRIFEDAATDIAGYVSKGLDRVEVVDELQGIATAHGLLDVATVQQIISDALNESDQVVPDEPVNGHGHGHKKHAPKPTARLNILSKQKFIAMMTLPDYLIDGLFQRRFLYAMTGQTGHAKTAVALLIAQLVSCTDKNAMLGTHRAGKGRVIYFVGENPDDVRYRIVGSDAQRTDNPEYDNISFIPGIFNIAELMGVLKADCERNGEAALIVVDTSAAYFLGDEELSNTQMGAYARTLRLLTTLPGGPCVLVLCHPIKHVTEPSQLLPRGGGAYLAEMDGNLTLWRLSDDVVELHHTKIRGPGFQAISFKLETIKSTKLVDKSGRPFSTVRAVAITQREEDQRLDKDEEDEDHVIAAMLAKPPSHGGSFATWAQDIGWVDPQGEPYKKKVERIISKLSGAKPKLTTKLRNKWTLTEDGKTAAREAALRFESARRTSAQASLL